MNNIKNNAFLLTGGAGFIGSHLCDFLLDNGARHVIIIDNFFLGSIDNLSRSLNEFNERVTVIKGDASSHETVRNALNQYNVSVVINLATKALLHSFSDPHDAFRVNTDITLNLLELLRNKTYKKLIHISSSEVFGTAKTVPMDEDHDRRPETTYAAGKCAADVAVESYIRMFDVNAVILRPFNNFGPRQNTEKLAGIIPATVKRILYNENIVIHGDGYQTRDYIYVKDTVKIIGMFTSEVELNFYEYNMGSGIETSVNKIIDLICKKMNFKYDIKRMPERKADVKRHCANVERIEKEFGPMNLTNFDEAMDDTINFYILKFHGKKFNG